MENKETKTLLADDIRSKIVTIRGQQVLFDFDVARIYGIETRNVNQAVKINKERFPEGYVYTLSNEEVEDLRSKKMIANMSSKSRYTPKAFTEKGLYMLATIIKSPFAVKASLNIIETFAAVRSLRKELIEVHNEKDESIKKGKIEHFGQLLSDIVMPDLETSETESTLEINFFIGTLKHTVKRVKRND